MTLDVRLFEESHHTPSLHRPWLALYGHLLKPPSSTSHEEVELALIQRAIPNELMVIIFSHLDAYSLGKTAGVCRQWRVFTEHPRLWQRACSEAFGTSIPDAKERQKIMATQYRFSWKRMFLHHPHLRFDGLYASRNTYVRTGVAEFTNHKPVHLVSYFRYFRFLSDGTFLYRTSPLVVAKVARSLVYAAVGTGSSAAWLPQGRDAGVGAKELQQEKAAVLIGRYILRGSKVHCALVYPNSTSTELRCRLSLRSTHPGANNRLDIESIVTYDRELGTEAAVQPMQDPDADVDAPTAKAHSRGLAPCIFIPWDQVYTSPLNLPPSQMDFMIV